MLVNMSNVVQMLFALQEIIKHDVNVCQIMLVIHTIFLMVANVSTFNIRREFYNIKL